MIHSKELSYVIVGIGESEIDRGCAGGSSAPGKLWLLLPPAADPMRLHHVWKVTIVTPSPISPDLCPAPDLVKPLVTPA